MSHWDDFDRLHQQLLGWITDVEGRLLSDPEFKADLPEKRSSLEKYKVSQVIQDSDSNTFLYKNACLILCLYDCRFC